MKNKSLKLAGILLALLIALTGCSLIKVDPVMQADEDMENAQKAMSKVIATYDGGQLTKFDVMYDYSYTFSYQYYMYSMYGMQLDEATYGPDILTQVIESTIRTKAVENIAAERGITLTEEELASCDEQGKATYQEQFDGYYENAEGDTEEVRRMNTEVSLYRSGVTEQKCIESYVTSALYTKVEESIEAEIADISDDELATMLSEQATADEATYTESLSTFETDMTSADKFIAWRPSGYRTVKHILVKPGTDELSAVTTARSALTTAQGELTALEDELAALGDDDADAEATAAPRTAEEIQADIDAKNAEIETLKANVTTAEEACLASQQTKIDEIYAKLAAGEAFDAVMAEYGEDPGMQSEPAMSRGYYVSADSTTWDPNFRDGAMLLGSVGEYSAAPVISSSGIHIIYYNSDVAAGQLALADCRDEYYAFALETAKTEHFTAAIDEAAAALNAKYDLTAFFE